MKPLLIDGIAFSIYSIRVTLPQIKMGYNNLSLAPREVMFMPKGESRVKLRSGERESLLIFDVSIQGSFFGTTLHPDIDVTGDAPFSDLYAIGPIFRIFGVAENPYENRIIELKRLHETKNKRLLINNWGNPINITDRSRWLLGAGFLVSS